jgi:hypothetical protein
MGVKQGGDMVWVLVFYYLFKSAIAIVYLF